jgi:hypothetical protein
LLSPRVTVRSYEFSLANEGQLCNIMATTAAQNEAMNEIREELNFQRALLLSMDNTVQDRHEVEQEIRVEIKALRKKLMALQGTSGTDSSASPSQSSQPAPSNTLPPGSWPADDIVTDRRVEEVASSSTVNQLQGELMVFLFILALH